MRPGRSTHLRPLIAFLAVSGAPACGDPQAPPRVVEGPVDQPVPPKGMFGDLAAEEQRAALARIAEGEPLEALPAAERVAVEASNARDRAREPFRTALRGLAEARAGAAWRAP
jgi:hypothetical protein